MFSGCEGHPLKEKGEGWPRGDRERDGEERREGEKGKTKGREREKERSPHQQQKQSCHHRRGGKKRVEQRGEKLVSVWQ